MILNDITISAYQGYFTGGASPGEESGRPTGQAGGRAGVTATPESAANSGKAPLTPEQKQQVAQMQQRDKEVKAHEAAHVAAGGGFVRGGAQFSYETGPDGKRYAVGGEVSIDTSPVKDNPAATIAKMQTVRSAALAPANPSGQDRSVASAASSQEAQARQELSNENSALSGDDRSGRPDRKSAVTVHPGYNEKGNRHAEGAVASQVDLSV